MVESRFILFDDVYEIVQLCRDKHLFSFWLWIFDKKEHIIIGKLKHDMKLHCQH